MVIRLTDEKDHFLVKIKILLENWRLIWDKILGTLSQIFSLREEANSYRYFLTASIYAQGP